MSRNGEKSSRLFNNIALCYYKIGLSNESKKESYLQIASGWAFDALSIAETEVSVFRLKRSRKERFAGLGLLPLVDFDSI